MASMETTTTLNGLYKEVYADKIKDLIPESDVLLKMDNFVSKDQREGNKYHQPVLLALPTGATWGLGVVTLNTAIASTMGDAQVTGSAITHRDLLAYDAAAKAAKGGKQSFAEATGLVVKNLVKATSKFLELDLLFGGVGVSQAASSSNIDSTHTNVTLALANWAPAIFSGMEGAIIQFYKDSDGTLISSGTDSQFTIVAQNVVPASSTVGGVLKVSGSTTGISALDTALGSGTAEIYWLTANGNQMSGLQSILTNSGTLFNISASSSTGYSLWASNTFDCGSTQLTFGKLQNAMALGVNRGLDSKVKVLVSPATFANLVDEQAGARRYDSSYESGKAKNGVKGLEFFSANGLMEIVPHIFMHQGKAMIIPEEETIRMGPVDGVTSTLPGMPGEFFVQSQTFAAYELRNYANEAIFIEAPAHAIYVKNITNV